MLTELVDIAPYDWSRLPPCGFFEVLGKRGTGKTSWTQYITQFSPTRNTGNFIVVGGSETAKASWSKIVHPIFVYDPDISQLESLRDTQNEVVRRCQKNGEMIPPDRHVTIILDDVSSNKQLMRSQILAYLASNSRHLQMSIFVLVQYHCQVVSEVRNQFDTVFMLSTSDRRSIERVHSEYCSIVDLRVFKHVLGHVTKDFGMLVIDNQSTDTAINTVCFHATMDPYPPLLERLGSPNVWGFGDNHYGDPEDPRPDHATAQEWKQCQVQEAGNRHVVTDRKGKLIIRKT